tara:strand:- start:834 stop:1442 length:609 start_codon:yes stop_codon:yes gene_type:complete
MAGSDVQATLIEAALADPNGISLSAQVGNNANLVIGGALADGGAVTFDEFRNVTITSGGNDSDKSFTITGTSVSGAALVETLTGGNAGIATGTSIFATVTQITAVGNPAGTVEAGSGTTVQATIFAGRCRLRGLYAVNTATGGKISFRESSETGPIRMQFNTVSNANTTEYPDIPDEGLLCKNGAYVTYSSETMSSLTVFFN